MNDYRHRVSGYFEHPAEADGALSALLGRGIPRERMWLMPDGTASHLSSLANEGAHAPDDRRKDAVTGGHVVLLVETHTADETSIVRAAMQGAVEDIKDVNLVEAPLAAGGLAA